MPGSRDDYTQIERGRINGTIPKSCDFLWWRGSFFVLGRAPWGSLDKRGCRGRLPAERGAQNFQVYGARLESVYLQVRFGRLAELLGLSLINSASSRRFFFLYSSFAAAAAAAGPFRKQKCSWTSICAHNLGKLKSQPLVLQNWARTAKLKYSLKILWCSLSREAHKFAFFLKGLTVQITLASL